MGLPGFGVEGGVGGLEGLRCCGGGGLGAEVRGCTLL